MVEEVLLDKTGKTFKRHFIDHKYSPSEIKKREELSLRLFDFYKKVDNPKAKYIDVAFFDLNFLNYEYTDEYGYVTFRYAPHGLLEVQSYGYDLDIAFVEMIDDILFRKSINHELYNRRTLKKEFKNDFGKRVYFSDYYVVKYIMDAFLKYYNGYVPEEIVKKYELYLDVRYNSMIHSKNKYKKHIDIEVAKKKVLEKK